MKPISSSNMPLLQSLHQQWIQLQMKGQLRMKRKIIPQSATEQKKEYYDFDFTRYQYYYNYPHDHIAFKKPYQQEIIFDKIWNDFIMQDAKGQDNKHVSQHDKYISQDHKSTNNINQFSLNNSSQYFPQTLLNIKPYQLQHFIYNYVQQIKSKIRCLRLKRSLLTPKRVSDLLDHQSIAQLHISQTIELIQTQIRSFIFKLTRFNDFTFQFNQDLKTRLQQKKSQLKCIQKDQLHFTQVQRADFVIYQRLIKTKNTLKYNINCLNYNFTQILKLKFHQIQKETYFKSVQKIKKLQYIQNCQYQQRKQQLMSYLTLNQPTFLQQYSNLTLIQNFLSHLTYSNRFCSSSQSKLLLINISYSSPTYIPHSYKQLLNLVQQACSGHFSSQLIKKCLRPQAKEIYSEGSLCFRLQKLAATLFRITQETFQLTQNSKHNDIDTKRTLMQRQLETIFSQDIQQLIGLIKHQSYDLVAINQSAYYLNQAIQQKAHYKLSQRQIVFQEFIQNYHFKDPFLVQFASLLFTRKQRHIHQVIQSYIKTLRTKQSYKNKLRYLLTFYDNLHNDPKNHLINILNSHLNLSPPQVSLQKQKFLSILQKTTATLSIPLLKSVYFLRITSTIIMKNKLLSILNGQINLMIKVKQRIIFFRQKHNIRFQMSKQFITRYTETNQKQQDPFDFIRNQHNLDDSHKYQAYLDKLIIIQTNNKQQQKQTKQQLQQTSNKKLQKQSNPNSQKQNNNNKTKVFVKRTVPSNQLFEGNNIIYDLSIKQLENKINRLVKIGSKMIQKRQNYLNADDLTLIVDRVQLLHELIEQQTNYQLQKLKLLNQYYLIFQITISSQGIQKLINKIYKTKKQQFCMSLNQNYFKDDYKYCTQNLRLRRILVQKLRLMQLNLQKQQINEVRNGMIRKNFNQHFPQISSIYYTQALDENGIQQQNEQQSNTMDQNDDIQSVLNQVTSFSAQKSQHRNSLNQSPNDSSLYTLSNFQYKHSDYHVKKSFKQIMGNNQTSSIKKNIQKKQKMLNRKKKRVFNDTILGRLLAYQQNLFSQHLYYVVQVLDSVQANFNKCQKYAQVNLQNTALRLLIQHFNQFKIKSYRMQDKFPQQLIQFSIHQSAKLLSKLVQKLKSNPSSIKHYLCFDMSLIQGILNNNSSKQVNQYRGLYLCLNHIQISNIFYKSLLNHHRQQSIKQHIYEIVNSYSSLKVSSLTNKFLQPNMIENYFNQKEQFHLIKQIQKNNQYYLMLIGKYGQYVRMTCSYQQYVLHYYEHALTSFINDQIQNYQQINIQMQLVNHGCRIKEGYIIKLGLTTRIQNKLYISKKIDQIKSIKNKLISHQFIDQLLTFPHKILIQTIKKPFKPILILQTSNIVDQINKFTQYLLKINELMCKMIILNWNIQEKCILNNNLNQIQKFIKIMPHIDERIKIKYQTNKILNKIFTQQVQLISQTKQNKLLKKYKHQQQMNQIIQLKYEKLGINFIVGISKRLYGNQQLNLRFKQFYNKMSKRQYLQFKSQQQAVNQDRQTNNYLFKFFQIGDPFMSNNKTNINNLIHQSIQTNKQLKQLNQQSIQSNKQFKFSQQFMKVRKLKRLIESRLLLFGLQLTFTQLLVFRTLLLQGGENVRIFFKDQTSSLFQSKDIVKLKHKKLDSSKLLQQYKNQYLTYNNLKFKYKCFIQKLKQSQIQNQLQNSQYLLIIASKIMNKNYNQQNNYLKFLNYYGQEQQKIDKIKQFFNKLLQLKIQLKQFGNNFQFNQFKKSFWNTKLLTSWNTKLLTSSIKQYNQFKQFQERQRFLCQHINLKIARSKKPITNQLLHFKFQQLIVQSILKQLNIDSEGDKMKLQIFGKSFQQKTYGNFIQLNQKQRYFLDLSAISPQVKSHLKSLKDQALNPIYFIKFYLHQLKQRYLGLSCNILKSQLELQTLLSDSLVQRQLSLDLKILNSSLNKLLAPKITLNPFLNSPLLTSNYFFAGALKLSYIDHFLNRLRNRAVMVQLAQGGVGFLIKVQEIDQAVNALCKGIISYSQKEFHDRLRTYFQYTQELKQKLLKIQQQNTHLKALNKLHSFYDQKQIKSFIYDKLNTYLNCITDRQHVYDQLFEMYRSLQSSMMKQCEFKYQSRIRSLQQQNINLRGSFKKFTQSLKNQSISAINESKDTLYQKFKQKSQQILIKQFIPTYDQLNIPSFEQKQQYESTLLISKLRQKDIIDKMKIRVIQEKYQKRIKQLERKLQQKDKLLQDMQRDRQKIQQLMQQVNILSHNAIQVEALKITNKRQLQDSLMEKFKLIRVNQSLNGRLQRLNQKDNNNKQPHNKDQQIDGNAKIYSLQKNDIKLNQCTPNKISFNQTFRQTKHKRLVSDPSIFITKQQKSINREQIYKQSAFTLSKPVQRVIQKLVPIQKSQQKPLRRSFKLKTQPSHYLNQQSFYQTKLLNIEQGVVWRDRWEKSQVKYQKFVNAIKNINQNYLVTRNVKKLHQKLSELIQQQIGTTNNKRKSKIEEILK